MTFDEQNIFAWAGTVENREDFSAVVALYDYFWVLKPEVRKKVLTAWIEAFTECLDDDFLAELAPDFVQGDMVLLTSEDPVEIKDLPENVIPFRRK
ncbi:MAG: hypothetical protein VW518_00440 [Burkholderiaceae bacterium]